MPRSFAILVFSLLTTGTASAQPTAPSGPPPTLSLVSKTIPEKGLIVLVHYEPVTEQFPIKDTIKVNGKDVEVTKYATRVVYKSVLITMDIADGRVITPDGKQLPIDEVWKRLKPNTVLVVSGDLNRPSPEFLRALSAETLVLIPAPMKK